MLLKASGQILPTINLTTNTTSTKNVFKILTILCLDNHEMLSLDFGQSNNMFYVISSFFKHNFCLALRWKMNWHRWIHFFHSVHSYFLADIFEFSFNPWCNIVWQTGFLDRVFREVIYNFMAWVNNSLVFLLFLFSKNSWKIGTPLARWHVYWHIDRLVRENEKLARFWHVDTLARRHLDHASTHGMHDMRLTKLSVH